MRLVHFLRPLCLAGLLSILAVPAAHAAYVMTIAQVANNIVATGSGSINITALTKGASGLTFSQSNPNFADVVLGPTSDTPETLYSGDSGPSEFGTNTLKLANSGSGSIVGISVGGVNVPQGYVSGTDLGTSTDTWNNQTFASMGMTTGTYTYTWGTGPTADSLTVNIGVPEPTSLGLLAVTSIALLRRRQRASA